ncbi:TPA: hypothetical protein RQO00_005131 [Klebsiella oxytoca]|nr:hypothetical protein [Klebsiella oxytoca]
MQIREQGRKIQCIRTVYDKAIGRGRQTVIATLARYTTEMPTTGLVTLAKAIREGQELRPEQAAAIWHGMGEVGKAMRKAGHAKPKAIRKGKPVDPADPKDQGEGAPKGK